MDTLLEKLLKEYKTKAKDWLTKNTGFNLEKRYKIYNDFFKKIKNKEFEKPENFKPDFEKICEKLHSLSSNALAKAKAKNNFDSNHLAKFEALINTKIPIEERIERAIKNKEYKIFGIGQSTISEIIAYNQPEEYTFYNHRNKQVVTLFNPNFTNNKFSELFIEYNEFVKKEILPKYKKIIYDNKTQKLISGTTLMLEIDQFFSWLYENKNEIIVQKENKTDTLAFEEVTSCKIDEITISNFYSISDKIELSDLKDKNFIFLLGENGSGKTILLKAILITLKKYFIDRKAPKRTIGIISEILDENQDFEGLIKTYAGEIEYEFNVQKDTSYIKNLYAYGTNRHLKSRTQMGEEMGFLTLFQNDEYLKNTEEWLKSLRFKELDTSVKTNVTIKDVEKIFSEFLNIENLELTVNSEKVSLKIEGVEYSFRQLSEGYIGVLSFITDLLARLIENNPEIKKTEDYQAIVLVDELDMFLHPEWEKNICGKLHSLFPKIQFIISTHSPIIVEGASKNNDLVNDKTDKLKIFKIKKDGEKTVVEKTGEGKDVRKLQTFDIINSDLFDDKYVEIYPKEYLSIIETANLDERKKLYDNISKLKENEEEIKKLYLEKLNLGGQKK